ncbi:MBL fold metallo-hydrolase [Paenibacillus albidus]|uniref:MBL fold metallo-hydrolase n=1 Tax=Paenibacillus albidus TaxID=2041023 RepID=UPI001BE5CBCB|nr:MBL fold metallo-hydrolase [Paenibacillus albidus]MBT2290269.1 MBL fold metallo-hydrolase [Paenibacillus albidus]
MVSGRRLRRDDGEGSQRKVEIIPWEGGSLLQVSVPMDPPLRQVNSYILPEGADGITVIDPGPRSPETESVWQAVLDELGLSWNGIREVVVTHHHPDHYGLSGWMQSRSGCKVRMTRRAHQEALLMWGGQSTMNDTLPAYFAGHGMPESWTTQIYGHLLSFEPQVTPQPQVSYIDPAEPFVMGGRTWKPLVTGGHAPGQVSFYHAESGHLLCGDAVLPQISPNVSLLPGSDESPLLTFLQGLEQLGSYPVSLAFPGHREPFSGWSERTHSLIRHHEERLQTTEALLAAGPGSGFEVCDSLFRGRIASVHQMRFAMSETLAHLVELVRRERAVTVEQDGITRFALKESASGAITTP